MILENFFIRKYSFLLLLVTQQLNITINIFNEFSSLNFLIDQNLLVKKLFFSFCASQRIKFLLHNFIFCNCHLSIVLKNFLILLIRKNMLAFVKKIFFSYKGMFLKIMNFNFINITFKNRIAKKEIDKMKNLLYYIFTYRNIIFNFFYNKNILGGVIVDIGRERLDLSFLFKLNYIKLILKDKILWI